MPRAIPLHGRDHRPGGADPVPFAEYEFKLFADSETVVTGDGRLIWRIPRSVDGLRLVLVSLYVTTVSSSGAPTLQIHNVSQAADILSTKVSVESSEYVSEDAAVQPVINSSYELAVAGERWRFDVDAAGTGAMGMGGSLTFG